MPGPAAAAGGEARGSVRLWLAVGAAALLVQLATVGLIAALTWVIVRHHKVRPAAIFARPPSR